MIIYYILWILCLNLIWDQQTRRHVTQKHTHPENLTQHLEMSHQAQEFHSFSQTLRLKYLPSMQRVTVWRQLTAATVQVDSISDVSKQQVLLFCRNAAQITSANVSWPDGVKWSQFILKGEDRKLFVIYTQLSHCCKKYTKVILE